jgi:hypothetical protein
VAASSLERHPARKKTGKVRRLTLTRAPDQCLVA